MRLIQFKVPSLGRCLGVVQGREVYNITEQNLMLPSVHAAFHLARSGGRRLDELLLHVMGQAHRPTPLDYRELLEAGRVLPPVTEEHGTRLLVSGTGLTHLGSARQRDAMHQAAEPAGPKSPSRTMFELGLAGGRPEPGQRGTAPEWFYKGDGRTLRGPGESLDIPPFAPDGGEEPEIAGVYAIDGRGVPCRLGFVQGNEWSDHVTENVNYLYLAPSKLRTCSIGPELVTNFPFGDVRGVCRVRRAGEVIYDSGELLTGEANMCHSLANIEDHLFKFPEHRTRGDVHVHFFGTSKLSFPGRDWQYRDGDVVEVSFQGMGEPLRNPVRRLQADDRPVTVEVG